MPYVCNDPECNDPDWQDPDAPAHVHRWVQCNTSACQAFEIPLWVPLQVQDHFRSNCGHCSGVNVIQPEDWTPHARA